MSVQDERELRDRLTGLLEDVAPNPAPVARAVRRGKAIRIRRWASVAAVVALIAAGAAVTPTLLRAHAAGPASQRHHTTPPHYKITIKFGGWQSGVIAQGVTDGKSWQVIAPSSSNGSVQVTGPVGLGSPFSAPGPATWPVNFESESTNGTNGFSVLVGTVSPAVARLSISLSDQPAVGLAPVRWKGARWVAVVLQSSVPIVRAVAYSANGHVLAYSVPWQATAFDLWLRPGQAGPARVRRLVGSGVVDGLRWRTTADFGPWGYCFSFAGGADVCEQGSTRPEQPKPGKLMRPVACGGLAGGGASGPFTGLMAVAPDVGSVALKFADGKTESFRSVEVGGGRSLAFVIPKGARVVSYVAYSLSGRILGSTPGGPTAAGAPMTC